MDWSPARRPALRPAGFVEPCIPTLADRPPTGSAWLHEIKHDGYRLMVWRNGERVRLFTQRGFDWTDRYPRITHAAGRLLVARFLIDGEAVVVGPDGVLDSADLRGERLDDRRAKLGQSARRMSSIHAPGRVGGIRLSESLGGDGELIFRHEQTAIDRAIEECAAR
jgi:hypothetical protein